MFFFVWFFIPETKGISLEAMDRLFGVTEAPAKSLAEDNPGEGSDNKREIQEKRIEVTV